MSFKELMMSDHRDCDRMLAEAEAAASHGDWPRAAVEFRRFSAALQRHFEMEEQVLFPRFEAAGGPPGPGHVMRGEHQSMRALLEEMAQALAGTDSNGFLGGAETLLLYLQQHNLKEEQILYPMAEELLRQEMEKVVAELHAHG